MCGVKRTCFDNLLAEMEKLAGTLQGTAISAVDTQKDLHTSS